jgi:hypothetical protein
MSKTVMAFILCIAVLILLTIMNMVGDVPSQVVVPIITGIGMGAIGYLFPSPLQ